MDWLNYHHLLYFWTVIREGGVSRAAAVLRLSQPTISAQVRALETALGERLLERQGRGLVMTDAGRIVFRHAEEIFGIGREMVETLKGRPTGQAPRVTVGVANAVPKLVAYRLLRPATQGPDAAQVSCVGDRPEALIARLAAHEIDLIISDAPAPPHLRVKVFNHLLGESGTTFFAGAKLAARLRRGFPRSLDGVAMLLPSRSTDVRRSLDQWFDTIGIRPRIEGEFDDTALMKTFGEGGHAVFPAPTAIAADVNRRYRVTAIGAVSEVRERYYVISAERRVKHPSVITITATAKDDVFVESRHRP